MIGINEFRMKVQDQVIQMRGTAAMYGDDQGESAWLVFGTSVRWEDIVSQSQNQYGRRFLSISLSVKNKEAFHKDMPLAFYDDFADLNDRA